MTKQQLCNHDGVNEELLPGAPQRSSAGTGDVRWAVNYLLEQIAAKFEAWETLDLFRSDAAATLRSFKHDLAASDDLPADVEYELWHKAITRLQEIADDDARGRYGRLAREALEHLATLQFLGPASPDRITAVPQPPSMSAADAVMSQIEERFPNWKSYRDLVDCIDCTLHALRGANR